MGQKGPFETALELAIIFVILFIITVAAIIIVYKIDVICPECVKYFNGLLPSK